MKYRVRTEEVDAVRWKPGLKHPFIKEESTLEWSGKPYATVGEAGWEMHVTEDDWILTHEDGNYSVIGDELFRKRYQPVSFEVRPNAKSEFIPGEKIF